MNPKKAKRHLRNRKKRLLREDDPSLHQVYKSKSDRSKGEERPVALEVRRRGEL